MRPRFIKFLTHVTALAALIVTAVSCSPRKVMINEFVGMMEDGLPAIEQEDDLHLLARSMPAHIKLLETLLQNDPDNQRLLTLLSRIYGGYAFALLESEWEARQLEAPSVVDVGIPGGQLGQAVARAYHMGAEYALRSLEVRHPGVRQQLNQLALSADFIRSLDSRDLPALFWYGFNLGGTVRHRMDSVEAMAKAHLVQKAMTRVIELNPSYERGNADLVLLVYHASRPPMLGGNPGKARQHLQEYRNANNGRAGLGDVFLARYLLTREQEKETFVKRLAAVPQTPDTKRPFTLLDRVAAVRARTYLEAKDRFFD